MCENLQPVLLDEWGNINSYLHNRCSSYRKYYNSIKEGVDNTGNYK